MILDHLQNWRKSYDIKVLRRAFELLETPEVKNLPDGRHELEPGRIIALPQSYVTKPPTQGRWEAHRKFIDIQYVVSGREAMGYAPLVNTEEIIAYDPEKDVAFYRAKGIVLTVEPGMFAVFFPQDVHMPQLAVSDQPEPVRKIVVKVAVE